jgi:hypothetical protein
MQGDTAPRPSGITQLAILAAIGGILGLLAGLLLLAATLGDVGWGTPAALLILVFSVAELAFAYGAWTQAAWAMGSGPRAAGFAVAIALIVVAVGVAFLTPVTTTVTSG